MARKQYGFFNLNPAGNINSFFRKFSRTSALMNIVTFSQNLFASFEQFRKDVESEKIMLNDPNDYEVIKAIELTLINKSRHLNLNVEQSTAYYKKLANSFVKALSGTRKIEYFVGDDLAKVDKKVRPKRLDGKIIYGMGAESESIKKSATLLELLFLCSKLPLDVAILESISAGREKTIPAYCKFLLDFSTKRTDQPVDKLLSADSEAFNQFAPPEFFSKDIPGKYVATGNLAFEQTFVPDPALANKPHSSRDFFGELERSVLQLKEQRGGLFEQSTAFNPQGKRQAVL